MLKLVPLLSRTNLVSKFNFTETCPPMLSSSLMKIQCSFDNKIMKNCTDPIDNTQAQFFCAPYYEDERKVKFKAICNNGKWSEQVPQCVPGV